MGSTTNRLDPVEDYARLLMQQATARILENTGFAQAGERALTTLTDITRFMMQKLWIDAKQFAEHAGRIEPNFTDAHMVFENLQFNVTELHDYLQQTYSIPPKRKVPQFPVQLESSSSSLYDPVSERELAERSEDIPRFMPPIHPEWCSNAVSPCSSLPITSVCDATQKSNLEETNSENSNETMMQQQQSTASDNNKDENGMQQTNNQRGSSRSSTSSSKCRVAFPDFSGLTAKDLGLIRQKRSSFASLQNAEPSGISSSANISSAHSNDNINTDHNANTNNKDTTTSPVTINTAKLKHRKAVNHIINIANKDDTSNTSNNAEKLYHHHQQTKLTVSQQQQQSVSTSNVNDNSANQPSTSTNTEAVSVVRSKEVISSQLKLESDETQSENNFPVRRASGMFGMPPSAVVMHHHQHHHAALGGARMVSTASDSNLLRTAGTGSGAGSGGGGGGASDDGGSPGKSKKKKAKKLHDKEKKEKHKSKDKSHKEKRKQQQQQEIGGCSLNATASCSSSISSSSCSVFGMNTTQATSTISTSYLQVASAASLVTAAAAAAATGKQLISTSRQQFQLHDDLPLSAALVAARGGAGAEPCAVPGTSMNTSCWLDNATIPKSESVRLDVSQVVDEKPSIGCAASSSGLVTKFHVSSTSSSHKAAAAAAALKSPSNNTNEVRRQTHSTKISVSSEQESCSKKSIVTIGSLGSNAANTPKKERKNNKRERGKPRIKSVAIVPSDDSSSDSGIQGDETPKITVKLSRTSDAQQNKDLSALSSSSKAAASEVTMRSQNESQEKEKGDEVVSEAQLNSIEEALMGRLSPKTWEDEGRGEGELVLVVDGKEKSTDGVITASGGVVKKRKHKREKDRDRDKYDERENMVSAAGGGTNHEQQQQQPHFHRHKEKKREKDREKERTHHRKEKRKERDTPHEGSSHSERHRSHTHRTPPPSTRLQLSEDDLKHSKKRLYTGENQERERIDGEPMRKIPKLKIIIGGSGGTSSVQASPSSNSSPISSPHINNNSTANAIEQIKLKVKAIVTSSQDSRNDSQSCLSPGTTKSLTLNSQQQQQQIISANENSVDSNVNMKSVDAKAITNNDNTIDVNSNKKSDNERKEPKRPPCVTKAELKAVVKSSGEKKQRAYSSSSATATVTAPASSSVSIASSQQSKSKRHEINDDNSSETKEKNHKMRSSSQAQQDNSTSSGARLSAERSSEVVVVSRERERERERDRDERQREHERERERVTDNVEPRERLKELDVKRFERSVKREEKEKHKQAKEKLKDDRQKQREKDLEKERKKNGKTDKDTAKISTSSVTKASSLSSGVPRKEKDSETASLSSKSDKYVSELKASAKKRKEKPQECITVENDDSPDKDVWICPECSVAYVDGATDMVGCDACDNWFHWSCVGLLVAPPVDVPWYCQSCAKKHAKRGSSSSNRSTPSGKRSRK